MEHKRVLDVEFYFPPHQPLLSVWELTACFICHCVPFVTVITTMLHNKQNLKDTINFISHISRIGWRMARWLCFSWLGLFTCQDWLAVSCCRLGVDERHLHVFHPLQTSGPPPLVAARVQEREHVKIYKASRGLDLELVCCHFYLILLAKASHLGWGMYSAFRKRILKPDDKV